MIPKEEDRKGQHYENNIKETKRVAADSNKSYDFADGQNTLQIGSKNAKLVDNTFCRDENGIAFKCYAIFELTGDIKNALLETIQEGIENRISHNILCERVSTTGTISSGTGVRHDAPIEISIKYDPISRSRVLYVWDGYYKTECPIMGITLKTSVFKNYSKCICNLAR